jgi:hypothetical protein
VIRAEFQNLRGWEGHHHRLVARLLLILVGTVIVDAVGTILIFMAERHARGTDIHTLGSAFFFTTVQLLTVSSQIRNPFTPLGRAIDIALEMWAVLVVAGSAGAFAAFLQDADRPR